MQNLVRKKCEYGISVIKFNENKIVFGKNFVLRIVCNRKNNNSVETRTTDLHITSLLCYHYANETLDKQSTATD
jgi:hypothetical protein